MYVSQYDYLEARRRKYSFFIDGTNAKSCLMLLTTRNSSLTSATVTVAAGGNITLKVNGAVDTTIGGGTGIIDMATYDTMLKVVNHINGSANWCALLCDCLETDASADAFEALTETSVMAQGTKGLQLWADVAVTNNLTLAVTRLAETGDRRITNSYYDRDAADTAITDFRIADHLFTFVIDNVNFEVTHGGTALLAIYEGRGGTKLQHYETGFTTGTYYSRPGTERSSDIYESAIGKPLIVRITCANPADFTSGHLRVKGSMRPEAILV